MVNLPALDYFLLFFCPIKTYFVINNIDKNNLFSVVIVGLILDIMYQKILFNLIILLLFYFVIKGINFKKKHYFIKNILLYGLYFNIMFFIGGYNNYYLEFFILGFILQILYIFYDTWLLK